MLGGVAAVETALATSFPGLAPLQSGSGENTLVFVVFFVIGLLLVYGGFRQWQQMRLIQDTPTEKVRSAAVGRTELSGSAEPIEGEGTIPQPFTDGEALVASYSVEEWEEDHDPDHDDPGPDGHWSTVDSGALLVPFALDDGTGRMRVEPEPDATFEVSEENQTDFRVGLHEQPPDQVVEFFERQYEDDDDGLLGRLFGGPDAQGSDKRRYSQEVIPPGEDVYLLGGAEPVKGGAGSNADRLVLRRDEGSEEFIISDKSEEELVSGQKWSAPALIVVGILLSAAMLYLILA